MDLIGIDIGTVSIKYVRWRGKRGKGTIVSSGEYPFQGGWKDLEEILATIRSREGGSLEAIVGVTSQEILKKSFTIPNLPKNEMAEAIAWSASKTVPTPLDEMDYENFTIGEVEERGVKKNEILFVGARKEYVSRILSTLEGVGFKRVVAFTDTGLACVPYVGGKQEGAFAVVDIGGRQTGIYIFGGRKLRFVREIMTASESFTDALISGFGFSYEEAETYKREKGFTEEASDILSLPLDRLTGEIQRTLSVYRMRYPQDLIDTIYITGKASKTPGLLGKLRQSLAENVDYPRTGVAVADELMPAYFLCRYKDALINILPREIKAREREDEYVKWIRIATVAVASVLVVLSLGLLQRANRVTNVIDIERTRLSKAVEQLKTMASEDVVEDSQSADIASLRNELARKDWTFVTLLKFLSTGIPGDVYLREVGFDRYQMLDVGPKDSSRAGSAQPGEGRSMQETVKSALKESLLGETAPPRQSTGPNDPSARETPVDGGYHFFIRGYVVGPKDAMEPALLDFLVKLQKSGMTRDISVVKREVKELKGKKVMEFVINGRCLIYEI